MANTLITPQAVAEQALASLYESTVMLPLVHTDVTSDFAKAKVGDTVNVRKPATFVAKDFVRANGIEVQDATEDKVPVVLNKFKTVDFEVTAEDFNLKIDDLDTRLITPAAEALSQAIDKSLVALRSDITAEVGQVVAGDPFHAHAYGDVAVLLDAQAVLNKANVPASERYAVAGVGTSASWLNGDKLLNAAASGSTEALREASLGNRLFGFDPYWSQNIGYPKATGSQVAGDPTTEVSLAFHKSAFAFASAPQELPPGAEGYSLGYKGLNLRVTWGYSMTRKATIFSLDILYGVKTLDAARAVLIKGANKA